MISLLPPFEPGLHYEVPRRAAWIFRLRRDITVDLGLPIYGRASFRDADEREWVRLDDDALTIRHG